MCLRIFVYWNMNLKLFVVYLYSIWHLWYNQIAKLKKKLGTPYYAHLQNLNYFCFNQTLTPTPLLHKAVLNKTLPKALRTQALTALTSNFGLVGLVRWAWLGRFGLVGFVW